jgi:hypothetical protein
MRNDIQILDEVVNDIKRKINLEGYNKFEFCLILTLEIARYEMFTQKKLTDITADAISQLFAFQVHEFYYRTHPEIYDKCLSVFAVFNNYSDKLKNHDLPGIVGVKDENWIQYFNESLTALIELNRPNNR